MHKSLHSRETKVKVFFHGIKRFKVNVVINFFIYFYFKIYAFVGGLITSHFLFEKN